MNESDSRHPLSRRMFLLGLGGGAALVSLAWATREVVSRPPTPSGEDPIVAECCAHAEYDGWLVTLADKARLTMLVHYTDGWHRPEKRRDATRWTRWTRRQATLSFLNPRADTSLLVEYQARAGLFPSSPRTVTVSMGDRVLESFVAEARGRQRLVVPLPTAMLGRRRSIDIQIAVDRVFVPANRVPGSRDNRELGIRVFRATLVRNADLPD